MPEDFYDLLEVADDASPDEIKRAFRAKAREYHPDVSDDEDATAQFQVIQKAYDVLSDPEERGTYDRLGHRAYVADRLGGLPGIEEPTAGSDDAARGGRSGRVQTASASRDAGGRAASEAGRTVNADGGTTQGAGGQWRYYRTAPERASVPDRSTTLAVVVALTCYSFGVWRFLGANRGGVESFVGAATGAGIEGAMRALGSTGYGIEHPLGFAMGALASESVAALFPIGAVLLPVAVAVAAREFDRDEAMLAVLAAFGPLAELSLEYAATTGISVPRPLLDAVGVTLLLVVVLPACAVVVLGALFYQARA